MQTTNGHFNFSSHEQHQPQMYEAYESYDGSGYGSPTSSREPSMQWKPPAQVTNDHYDNYETYSNTEDDRANMPMSLNTRVRSPNHDAVGRHLLYETALLDTQRYEILDINEVDALKKEQERLQSRIEAASRKLMLEIKMKDAAQNLQRLYSSRRDSRPDTPQSQESPTKTRGSGLGLKGRTSSNLSQGGGSVDQAKDEFVQSIKKVDELNGTIKTLLERRAVVERKLLQHTAAVLAEQAAAAANGSTQDKFVNEHHSSDDSGIYTPNEFDGIRDILHGRATGASGDSQNLRDAHEKQLASMQDKLERLNSQLRNVIMEASNGNGPTIEPELDFGLSHGAPEDIEQCLNKLEDNVKLLEQSHLGDRSFDEKNAVEEQLEGLNTQLHSVMAQSLDVEKGRDLVSPPPIGGHGYQHQLQYMEESFFTLERLFREQSAQLLANKSVQPLSDDAETKLQDAHARADAHAKKTGEYETVLGGLWEIMSNDKLLNTPRLGSVRSSVGSTDDGLRSPSTSLREDFSIQAFNSRVQHLLHVASTAKEQQDILRRQIQQQRDLNGKSDMEKDREIAELQTQHEELAGTHAQLQDSHDELQESLAKAMVAHQEAEREASEGRSELVNVMNEFEQLQKLVHARTQDRDQLTKQLEAHHAQLDDKLRERDDLAQDLEEKHAELTEKHAAVQRDAEKLESEVVRLTTELTIAKADLEGAYGTRAERQKEAGVSAGEMEALQDNHRQVTSDLEQLRQQHKTLEEQLAAMTTSQENQKLANGDLEQLRSQHTLLESELQEMTQEFQEMTRESLELEKERGQLEGLIDELRDRCDALEAQLSDEKVRWLGVKSPAGTPQTPGTNGREAMSVMVLRQEFKRMMREARAEGVRLIRNEQEERRKLEAELRKIRQSAGPLARTLNQQQSNGPFSPQQSSTLRPE